MAIFGHYIVRVLTQAFDYQAARKYWKALKGRLGKEGSQLVTNYYQLKIMELRKC
jgi:DNA-damage-inducible protein D